MEEEERKGGKEEGREESDRYNSKIGDRKRRIHRDGVDEAGRSREREEGG